MGRRNRLRKQKLIEGQHRTAQSEQPFAEQRYRDLVTMFDCATANEAQGFTYLTMGEKWLPIECPHCGSTPPLSQLLANRAPCAQQGHPEQLKVMAETGRTPVPCPLCQVVPQFSKADLKAQREEDTPQRTRPAPAASPTPENSFTILSLREELLACTPTGHHAAARDFFVRYANYQQQQAWQCPTCQRSPQMAIAQVEGYDIVTEIIPPETYSFFLIVE